MKITFDPQKYQVSFQELKIIEPNKWGYYKKEALNESKKIKTFVRKMEQSNYDVEAYPTAVRSRNGEEILYKDKLNLRIVTKHKPKKEIYQFSSSSNFFHAIDIFSPSAVASQVKYVERCNKKPKQRIKLPQPSQKFAFIKKFINRIIKK